MSRNWLRDYFIFVINAKQEGVLLFREPNPYRESQVVKTTIRGLSMGYFRSKWTN